MNKVGTLVRCDGRVCLVTHGYSDGVALRRHGVPVDYIGPMLPYACVPAVGDRVRVKQYSPGGSLIPLKPGHVLEVTSVAADGFRCGGVYYRSEEVELVAHDEPLTEARWPVGSLVRCGEEAVYEVGCISVVNGESRYYLRYDGRMDDGWAASELTEPGSPRVGDKVRVQHDCKCGAVSCDAINGKTVKVRAIAHDEVRFEGWDTWAGVSDCRVVAMDCAVDMPPEPRAERLYDTQLLAAKEIEAERNALQAERESMITALKDSENRLQKMGSEALQEIANVRSERDSLIRAARERELAHPLVTCLDVLACVVMAALSWTCVARSARRRVAACTKNAVGRMMWLARMASTHKLPMAFGLVGGVLIGHATWQSARALRDTVSGVAWLGSPLILKGQDGTGTSTTVGTASAWLTKPNPRWSVSLPGLQYGAVGTPLCPRCKSALDVDSRYSGEIRLQDDNGITYFSGCVACLKSTVLAGSKVWK